VLRGRVVVVGVSGGIAAYKACELVRWLKQEGAAVIVVMTPAAVEFVTPLTFRWCGTCGGTSAHGSIFRPRRPARWAERSSTWTWPKPPTAS